jgi:hypothetical protein
MRLFQELWGAYEVRPRAANETDEAGGEASSAAGVCADVEANDRVYRPRDDFHLSLARADCVEDTRALD